MKNPNLIIRTWTILIFLLLTTVIFEVGTYNNHLEDFNINENSGINPNPAAFSNKLSLSRGTNGTDNYTLKNGLIIDDFYNEDKISYGKNVIIDTIAGEAKLLIINTTYGGRSRERGYSVKQTSDDGYIITGRINMAGGTHDDVWLIKIDKSGNMEWNKTFHNRDNDYGSSVIQTTDGGYIIAGRTIDSGMYSDADGWVIKTDSAGNMLWNRTYSYGGNSDYLTDICQTMDGGYILTGSDERSGSSEQLWLLKINRNGTQEWTQSFNEFDRGNSIQITTDNGYIITGGDHRVFLIKTNSLGELQWKHKFSINNYNCGGQEVQQTTDGGFVIIGSIYSNPDNQRDIWLIKTDEYGNMEWNQTYGGTGYERGYSVKQTSDGQFIILGRTNPFGFGGSNIWLIKTDSSGNMLWNRTFGGTSDDWGQELQITGDDGYIFVGWTHSYGSGSEDVWLIKTDKFGNHAPIGSISSINLLADSNVNKIKRLNFTAEIPNGSSIKIQISQDNINWYNSMDLINDWDILINGSNSINLSNLKWQESNFYYRGYFSSENFNIPILKSVTLSFDEYITTDVPAETNDHPVLNDTDADSVPDLIDLDDDNDGFLDDWEIFLEANPLIFNDTPIDSDSDGIPDGDVNNTISWMDRDDDNDGMPDFWEIQYNLNPINFTDANLDKDNDGITNREEYENNTNPSDPEDPSNDSLKSDDDKHEYNLYLIIGVTVIIILVILALFINLKLKKDSD